MRARRFVLVAVSLWLAGCGGTAQRSDRLAGTLRIAVSASPQNLNPLFTTSTSEALVDRLVLDRLVLVLPDGTMEPVLAAVVPTSANGGISADGRTITYHLRHGVRWQDGLPFTSADVAFTHTATMNPANNVVSRQPDDRIARITTPDPFTLVVQLRQPYAPFITEWDAAGVLPAHLLAGKHDLNNDAFNGKPIGTGAFRITSWRRGEAIELAANRDYFAGVPRLRRIIVSTLPDENAEALALRTHEIDWIFEASAQEAHLLAGTPGVRLERFDVNEQDDISLNVTRPFLRDVRVRQALSLAVDRATLAKKLGLGFIVPATADIPSFMWAYDPTLRAPYDPARARALLDQAGWKPGADEIRVRDGKRLALVYLYSSGNPLEAGYAVQISDELRAVGVELQLKSQPSGALYALDGPGFKGQFDLAYAPFYWVADPDDTQQLSCATLAPHGNNWSRWCNPDFERWTTVALTHYDRPTRKAAYAHLQHIVLDQVPAIVTGWRLDAEPVSTELRGFRDHDTFGLPYRWSI